MLTNGGYDGLGKIREKEQELAAKYQQFKDFRIINDQRIPDGPDRWDIKVSMEIIE